MALFVIGDLHLSLGADKPMDIFPGWEGYLPRLEANWRKLISPGDTVVLAGDTSWAMNLNDTKADFAVPVSSWLPDSPIRFRSQRFPLRSNVFRLFYHIFQNMATTQTNPV